MAKLVQSVHRRVLVGICQRFTDRQFQTCVEANVLDLNSRYEEASKIKTLAVLDQIREQRGCPVFLRMENGPEFIAETLRDWCKELNTMSTIAALVHPGRTVASNHSTRDSETNDRLVKYLIRCGKSVLCLKNTATITTITVPIVRLPI